MSPDFDVCLQHQLLPYSKVEETFFIKFINIFTFISGASYVLICLCIHMHVHCINNCIQMILKYKHNPQKQSLCLSYF